MKIAVGSDHAGFAYKEEIRQYLAQQDFTVVDCGTYSEERADYPDFAVAVAKRVANHEVDLGICVCGSGIGVSISANKVPGVRAANCCSAEMATLARAHNDANVLCLGQRLLTFLEVRDIITAFLEGQFEGGRHSARVEKIHSLTGC